MYQFSEKLRLKSKIVFEKKAKRELTMGEVDLWLDRLASLGLLFVKNVMEGRTVIPGYEINKQNKQQD